MKNNIVALRKQHLPDGMDGVVSFFAFEESEGS